MKEDALEEGLPIPKEAAVRERVLGKNVEGPDPITGRTSSASTRLLVRVRSKYKALFINDKSIHVLYDADEV